MEIPEQEVAEGLGCKLKTVGGLSLLLGGVGFPPLNGDRISPFPKAHGRILFGVAPKFMNGLCRTEFLRRRFSA